MAPIATTSIEKVILAAPRGYCAGVDRAVQTVEQALDEHGAPIYVRKEIVHNKHVVEQLTERGAIFVEEETEVPEGEIVVFSAHGVAPKVHENAAERGLRTIDATCPLVTKVHVEARKFAADGYTIVMVGHEGHEEVEGTMGEAPESIVLVPELLRLLVSAVEVGWQVPGSLKFVAVGGAPVSLDLLERAERAGLPVFEGYGLSECASVVCLNTPEARRRGSVGRPLPHASVRVADDGQVMVSGATLLGYLGQPPRPPGEEWATGDLGEIDSDGFVHVRGRLRNVFISSLGRNVAPEWVEREIVQQPGVRHAMVHGEGRPHAVAIVCATDDAVSDAELARGIAAANSRLPSYAQVRRWLRAPEPFSFDNGLLTSNGRLRRAEILRRHGARLEALYHDTTSA